ncbi:MAG: glycerol kinase [Oleispira sp.]|jgi:glycerol kinase
MSRYLLAIDQGTTSSRAIVFDLDGHIIASSQQEFSQIFPQDGWVEHDPEEIWRTTEETCREAIKKASLQARDILSIGITNQRETTVVWDKVTGTPIYNAIVWQDRRTAGLCQQFKQKEEGLVETLTAKTGLLLDPYFSASKIAWILDNVEGARTRGEAGELLFGTIDTFLLWRLTGGKQHATDATNASRTLLFNIHSNEWDQELLDLFNVPANLLPEVRDCAADYGHTKADLFGAEIAIGGMAGDQQAALIGQACFTPGMAKSTYGTGCFMIMNTGDQALQSKNRLLTTIGYRISGKTTYALEGSIFMAGATIQWIRDGLQLISNAKESQSLAEETGADNSVYMVPAFTGLGAPYWDPEARGAIFGLARDTGIKEIVTAGLQAVCYQTRDLLQAMAQDGVSPSSLRVDGGMVVNDWLVQFLADTLGITIERPQVTETTALGVAYLAGIQAGVFDSLEQVADLWHNEAKFEPSMPEEARERLYAGWLEAVSKVLGNN